MAWSKPNRLTWLGKGAGMPLWADSRWKMLHLFTWKNFFESSPAPEVRPLKKLHPWLALGRCSSWLGWSRVCCEVKEGWYPCRSLNLWRTFTISGKSWSAALFVFTVEVESFAMLRSLPLWVRQEMNYKLCQHLFVYIAQKLRMTSWWFEDMPYLQTVFSVDMLTSWGCHHMNQSGYGTSQHGRSWQVFTSLSFCSLWRSKLRRLWDTVKKLVMNAKVIYDGHRWAVWQHFIGVMYMIKLHPDNSTSDHTHNSRRKSSISGKWRGRL